jgi:hypothetical protein
VCLSKRETTCGLAQACKPLNETGNLPSRLCRDAKTDGSMEYAHVTSRRMPAMKSVGERSAGNPHAAFDERGGETDRSNDTALLPDSTCEPGTRQVPFHLPPLTLVLPIAVGPRLKSHNFSIEDQAAAPCRSRKWRMTGQTRTKSVFCHQRCEFALDPPV